MLLFITTFVTLAAGLEALGAPNSLINTGNTNSGITGPVYGTTRYGRPSPWTFRGPPAYYRPYYYQSYPEDLYYRPEPIVHYPYYPIRPYKSDIYPYYYSDRVRPYTYYGDEVYDTVDDIPETDDQRTPIRSEALPVGQETWFENESAPRWRDEYDDVNAAFLQNLIMSQMYKDALYKTDDASPETSPQDRPSDYGEYYGERDTRDFEDEDVRELKALAGKPLYHVPKTTIYSSNNDKIHQFKQWQKQSTTTTTTTTPPPFNDEYHYDDYPSDEGWINWGSKRSPKQTARKLKQINKTTKSQYAASTTAVPPTAKGPEMPIFPGNGGQKEVVLPRPATPVRHPFTEPVMQMLASNSAQKKRTPSVYDTIKQLLTLEEEQYKSENKPKMQKRFVSTEEDLVGELKGLKRRSPL